MSAAREIATRVAACRAKAEALLVDLAALIRELPEEHVGESLPCAELGQEAALAAVRTELQEAIGWIEPALDYLTPRRDDAEPHCCALRRLQALCAAEESRPA